MTIKLIAAIRAGGVLQSAGSILTLDPGVESDFVQRGVAEWYTAQGAAGGAEGFALAHPMADERDIGTSNGYVTARRGDWLQTRVIGTTEVLVSNAPCHVAYVVANNGAVASTGYASLRDASAIGGGSTPKREVRATGGSDNSDEHGARYENGLTVQGSAAATDVTVLWRPL